MQVLVMEEAGITLHKNKKIIGTILALIPTLNLTLMLIPTQTKNLAQTLIMM